MARQTLGERLLITRRRRGISQRELAKRLAVSYVTISRIERGVIKGINSEVLRRLAEELKVSSDYLLSLNDDEDERLAAAGWEKSRSGRQRRAAGVGD